MGHELGRNVGAFYLRCRRDRLAVMRRRRLPRVDLASRSSRVTINTPRGSISAGVATSRKDHRLQTIDRAAPNSRKSETIAARRPNSFSARSVVFEPPGCPPSPLPETGLVAAGLCSAETGRPGAALAWDISVALEKPVLAIVPGYGVADLVLQGLGGWFAFGLHDFLSSKTLIQTGLATAAPETACIGRELAASTPQEPTARGGAPIFRYGSGSSDVLHALLEHRVTPFRLLVGHSKGALQINNAIQSLPAKRTQGLRVVTLGCPIGENVGGVDYHQYLGLFDALGQLNAWGHWPDYWPPTWHSTNPVLPPAMAVGKMTSESVRELKRSEAARRSLRTRPTGRPT